MEGQFFVKTKIISQAVLEIAVNMHSRFCPFLADFFACVPSKTAHEMIFVFTKKWPSIVVFWSYVGHVASSRTIPCCHLRIGVVCLILPGEAETLSYSGVCLIGNFLHTKIPNLCILQPSRWNILLHKYPGIFFKMWLFISKTYRSGHLIT